MKKDNCEWLKQMITGIEKAIKDGEEQGFKMETAKWYLKRYNEKLNICLKDKE